MLKDKQTFYFSIHEMNELKYTFKIQYIFI